MKERIYKYSQFFLLITMLSLFSAVVYGQSRSVSGKVTDENGTPLPGVSILIKGTQTGTTTDTKGVFTVKVKSNNDVLVFNLISYNSLEKIAGTATTLTIQLSEKKTDLNEVIVIGYGSTTRKDITGAVGRVSMADFEKAPVKSFDEALAGRVAGVQVSGNDGQPGASNNIVIRGANSLTQDNSPLYVIDGFPLEDANNNAISPADIESIDVLKDASATAIYGARGANGVIIITTKRGKKGDPVISYNAYVGIQKNLKVMELMSPYEFVKYQLELSPSQFAPLYLSNGKVLEDYRNVKGLDLQNEMFRTGSTQNHDFSIRGGTDKTKYSISSNILRQDGIIINSGFKRNQVRMSLDQTLKSNLRMGITANYSNSDGYGDLISEDSGMPISTSLLANVWGYRPVTGRGDENAFLDQLFDPDLDENANNDFRVNPIISAKNDYRHRINNTIQSNVYAELTFAKYFTLRINGGFSGNNLRNEDFYNSQTQKGNTRPISGFKGINGDIIYTASNTWLNEDLLTYKRTFNNDHNLTVLAGYTMQGNNSSRNSLEGDYLPDDLLGLDGIDQSTTTFITAMRSGWTLSSFLGRVNYDFKSKYLLTASFRADGSSKFAKGHQWGYFPSGAFAWRMSSEDFVKKLTFISDAKLRIGYGLTGNNRITDFAYYSTITYPLTSYYSFNNQTPTRGVTLTVGNPDLKWETTAAINIGYDLGLFNQRITFTADVYKKTTSDLLFNSLLPYSSGYANVFKNIGKLSNKGLELSLNTVNIKNPNFSWSSNFNISFNQNKILALADDQQSQLSTVSFTPPYSNTALYIAQIGKPAGQIYGAIFDGIYQYADFDKLPDGRYILKSGLPKANVAVQPGDAKYKDLNGDGVIDTQDFTIIGRGQPIHTGGFSNTFTYKGFDLNVFLQWSYGNDIVNANRIIFEGNAGTNNQKYFNQYATYSERWTPDNPSNTLASATGVRPFFYSTRIIEDGSYIRLKTVSLGYNFSSKLLSKIKLKTARIYASGQNLLTVAGYSGMDPEVSVRNSVLTPGFDFAAYPRARTITFGLNLSL